MRVLTQQYRSANCFLVQCEGPWMMIDTGWPDNQKEFFQFLGQNQVQVKDIQYLFITHFHPDHAGLVQNLKNVGVKMIVHESQIGAVEELNLFFRKNIKFHFTQIHTSDNIIISGTQSRQLLKSIGITGEVIPTPGHSDDSISLIIDDCAFTGDLPAFSLMEGYQNQTMKDSWSLIQSSNVKTIYPSHGEPYHLYEIKSW